MRNTKQVEMHHVKQVEGARIELRTRNGVTLHSVTIRATKPTTIYRAMSKYASLWTMVAGDTLSFEHEWLEV